MKHKLYFIFLLILVSSQMSTACRNPFDDDETKCMTPVYITTEKEQCFAQRMPEICVRVSTEDPLYSEKCRFYEDGILYLNQKEPRVIEEDGWYDCSYKNKLATTLDTLQKGECLLSGEEPLYTWMCVPDENVYRLEIFDDTCFAYRSSLTSCFIINTQQGYSENWQMCLYSVSGTNIIYGLSPYDWKTLPGWEPCNVKYKISETPCDGCCILVE